MFKTNQFSCNSPMISGFLPEVHSYGFNGKEKQNEHTSGNYDFGARILDTRLGRWLSIDPLYKDFPFVSPYNFANNNPIRFIDDDGMKWVDPYKLEVDNLKAELAQLDEKESKSQIKEINKKIHSLEKLSSRSQALMTSLKTTDSELFNYVENLTVVMTDADGNKNLVDVEVHLYVTSKTDKESHGWSFVGLTARRDLSKNEYFKGEYNGEEIYVPLSSSLYLPDNAPGAPANSFAAAAEFASLSKTPHIGFNVTVEDQPSYADERLANEIGDVMYAMEKNKEAYAKDKSGVRDDPSKNYSKYAQTGSGKYSFDVEDVYKAYKQAGGDKSSKSTEKKYPLK